MEQTIYRTVIQFEVLSPDPIPECMTMGQIEEECDTGSYSGRFLDNVETNTPLSGEAAASATRLQGSSPDFFQMDENGDVYET